MRGRNIFISYRRSDSAGFALALHESLGEAFGKDRLFMDLHAIAAGADFVSAIEEALGSCQLLVALIGPDWLEATSAGGGRRLDDPNDYVRLEIATALARGIAVMPVLVGDASMPRAHQLPEPLKPLSRRNGFELRNARFKDDVAALVAAMENILRVTETVPIRPQARRGLGAVAAAVGLAFAAYWTGLFNAFGLDDRLEVGFRRHMAPYAKQASGRNVKVIAASSDLRRNGTLQEPLGPQWRRYHAGLIDALSEARARVIVLDIEFVGPEPAADDAVRQAVRRATQRGTAVVMPSQGYGAHVGTTAGSPALHRLRLAERLEGPSPAVETIAPSLALQAVSLFHGGEAGLHTVLRSNTVELRGADGRAVERIPAVSVSGRHFDVLVDPPTATARYLEPVAYHQVYENRGNADIMRPYLGALVVVGFESDEDLVGEPSGGKDWYGFQLQAAAIASLLERRYPRRPTPLQQLLVMLALGALAWLLHTRLRPWLRPRVRLALPKPFDRVVFLPLFWPLALAVYLLAAFVVYRTFHVVPRFFYDLSALGLSYAALAIAQRPPKLKTTAAITVGTAA